MTTNDFIVVTKGCKDLSIRKGDRAMIVNLVEGERRETAVTFYFLNGWLSGKQKTLHARHANRLNDTVCRVHTGNPLQNIEFKQYVR